MKRVLLFCLVAGLWSCDKEDEINISYKELQNVEVKYNQPQILDIDGDNIPDYNFSTVLIGSPTTSKMQFTVSSAFSNRLLLFESTTPSLSNGDAIKYMSPEHYTWNATGNAVLVEKVYAGNDYSWQGEWISAARKYLPIQVGGGGRYYNGWIELSVDIQNEKVILHKAAVSNKAAKDIKAGY